MKIDVTPSMLRCQACNHVLSSDELTELDTLEQFCIECYAISLDAASELLDDDALFDVFLDKFKKGN